MFISDIEKIVCFSIKFCRKLLFVFALFNDKTVSSNLWDLPTISSEMFSPVQHGLPNHECKVPADIVIGSGRARGGAWGPAPLFWVKKEEITEGRKPSRASKWKPAPPPPPCLAQGLDLPLLGVTDNCPTALRWCPQSEQALCAYWCAQTGW